MTNRFLKGILGAFLILFSCTSQKPDTGSRSVPKIHVQSAVVQRMDMVDTVRFFGKIALRDEIFLASQFDGRLNDFHLYLGDRVKRGQKLGDIIPAKREALLQVLPRIGSQMRPMLENEIRTIPLVSPMDGVVLNVLLRNGDVLQKGQPIVHIGNLDVLNVLGDLPLRALPFVRRQSTVRVTFINYKHRPMDLPVAAIGGQVQRETQTVPVRLLLRNPLHEFRPGMRVVLSFPGKIHKNTLVIPRAALLEQEGTYSAFVITNGKVHKRVLNVGIKQSHFIEVLSGLRQGEQVVTQKAYSLVDGMEVTTE